MKKLLSCVILPQCILALLLALSFIFSRQIPKKEFIIVFVFEIILNIIIFCYYRKNKQKEKIEVKVLYSFLFVFIIIFSFGIFFLYRESLWFLSMSAPVFYLLFNAFSMFYLAAETVKAGSKGNKNDIIVLTILCIFLPAAIYVMSGMPSVNSLSMILAVGFLCTFLFLLGKLMYMSYLQSESNAAGNEEKKYTPVYCLLTAVVGIVLPVSGLTLNITMWNVMGDYSSEWFYIIAILNGVILLFDINGITKKLPVFYLKMVGFTYICYFALVFIPCIPLGLIGIMYFGLGLLVFAPAAVFFIQLRQILRDIRILKKQYSNNIIIFTALAGALTLPLILTANFKIDGINFNKAMAYVESGENVQEEVNLKRLGRSIIQIDNTMKSSRDMEFMAFGSGTPLISTLYRYIVFDNKHFTEKTDEKIQKIFTPENVVSESEVTANDLLTNINFDLNISTRDKEYIKELGAYKVWVDMEITLIGDKYGFDQEYKTNFVLPDGSFITDYYLYVGNEKKSGIMTDKRAAQIAYESIIRTPRDPGIIYYDSDNKLSLKVFPFPFENSYTRKTGFQIMYSQNGSFSIDGHVINLEAENAGEAPLQLDGVEFLPADYKKSLPKIERKPQYYFLIDAGKRASYENNIELAKKYIKEKNPESPIFYAVSYQSKVIKDINAKQPEVLSEGGFNTAYAVEEIFASVPQGKFPVIIMVTNNMNRVVEFEKTQMARIFPENDYYYRLNSDLSLIPYDFYSNNILPKTDEIITNAAVDYKGTAMKDDNKSEVVYSSETSDRQPENDYEKAFILQKNALQNKESKDQIAGIREAMQKRILTKNTAFIVMETVEQEKMLLDLQEKFLKGNSNETPSVMMSESGWAAVAAVIFIILFFRKRHKKNKI